MVTARSSFAIAYEPNRGVVLIGGMTDKGSSKEVESYQNGRFRETAALKQKLVASQAVAVSGSIYTFGE